MNRLLAVLVSIGRDTALDRRRERIRTVVDRVALSLFAGLLPDGSVRHDRQQTIAAIHADRASEVIATRTMLWAVGSGVIAACLAAVMIPATLTLIERSTGTATALTPLPIPSVRFDLPTVIGVTALGATLLAGGVAIIVHRGRWWWLRQRASIRERRIEATLPRTVAFIYALSRSGVPLPQILRTLVDTEAISGEAAAEFGVTVREMDTCGTDVITALEATSRRTPSDELAEVTTTLATVLDGDQRLADALVAQHSRFRETTTAEQEQSLDYLSMAAEAYVTVLVVGPLFLLTTLTIIGVVVADTLPLLRGLVYLAIPLGTLGGLLGLDRVSSPQCAPTEGQRESVAPPGQSGPTASEATDRWAAQRATLRLYDRLPCGSHWLRQPRAALLASPWVTCIVTVPVGLVWLAATGQVPSASGGLADTLVRSAAAVGVVVCAGYGAVHELDAHRRRRIEAAVPAFLDRLGSLNEAGLHVAGALQRVADSDLGTLTPAVERAWRDVQWGADLETALKQFATRLRSPGVSRAITLVTNASRASNDIAPVLSIAATELRAGRRFDRDRRRVTRTYLLVIYVAFLVFVGIVAALSATFLPAISTASAPAAGGTLAGGGAPIASAAAHLDAGSLAGYRSLFFHTAVVQAVCSGLVAGKLSGGTLRCGVKHVAVLLAVAHAGFWLI